MEFLYERVLERLWPMRQEEKAAGLGKSVTGSGSGDKGVYLNGGDRSVKLMTRVQNALRVGQYALETEKAYVDWILLMYGSGPRRKEACRVRVKDVDLERRQVQICDGKGDQGRMTVLPERLVEPLRRQIERVRRLHEQDLAAGYGLRPNNGCSLVFLGRCPR